MRVVERVQYGKRGQGSLIKLDACQFWISCYYANGREHRESTQQTDLKLAQRFHKRKLDEVGADRLGAKKYVPPMAQRCTVGDLLREWDQHCDTYGKRVKSRAQRKSHMSHLMKHLGHLRAVHVAEDSGHLAKYLKLRLEEGAASATCNREQQILGQAYKLGIDNKRVTSAPRIRRLTEAEPRQGFFSLEEFESVVSALPAYLQDVARFAGLCGWRKREVTELSWDRVDMDAGVVTLSTSKNGRPRTLAVGPELMGLLRRREAARLIELPGGQVKISTLVFHRGNGKSVGDFRKRWAQACIQAGLYKMVRGEDGTERKVPTRLFHDLRRSAVRNMIRAGVKRSVAMSISGHRSEHIFERYNITDLSDQQEAMAAVSRYVAEGGYQGQGEA